MAVLVTGVVFVHVGVALTFTFGGPERFSAPSYDVVQSVLPIHTWAFVFASIALLLGIAVYWTHGVLLMLAASAGGGVCVWWAVMAIVAAKDNPKAGLLGIVLWGGVTFLHIATALCAARYPIRGT